MRERKKRDIIAIGILATVIAVIPLFTSSRYVFSMCISIFTMAAFGTAWNIIGGYAGQIGFAHSAFFSIGAYSGVLCYLKLGISPWWGLLLPLRAWTERPRSRALAMPSVASRTKPSPNFLARSRRLPKRKSRPRAARLILLLKRAC